MSRRVSILLIGSIVFSAISFAQVTPIVTAVKDKVLIGEPFKVVFELKAANRGDKIKWKLPDSLPHFEYVSADTSDILKREIIFTSFDSGLWKIESIAAIVPSNVNNKPQLIQFPAKEIMIEYDTTGNQLLNDVKPIIEVNDGEEWIGYAVAAAALLSLLVLIILFRRWKKKEVKVIVEEESKVSPLQEFLKQVDELKKQSWATQQEQKNGFSTLTLAVKKYFERKMRRPFTKLTTDEVAMELKSYLLNERYSSITQALRMGDAVKFAKYHPAAADCLAVVDDMQQQIQKTEAELKLQ
jgi:hypothetical protein